MTPQNSPLGAGVDGVRLQTKPTAAAPVAPFNPPPAGEQPPPSGFLISTFILGLLPVVGYLGLGMAIFGLYQAHQNKVRPHGLLYGTVVLQLFYTLILLVLVTVVFRTNVPLAQAPKPTTASALQAEKFLQSIQTNEINTARPLVDSDLFVWSDASLQDLTNSIKIAPQFVSEQSVPVVGLKQAGVNAKYPNGAAALSLWRTAQASDGQRFIAIVTVEDGSQSWHIVMAQALEATSSGVAQQAAEQLILLEPVVQ